MHENPSKFWSFIKTSIHYRSNANFLRNGNEFIINNKNKAGHLNLFFHSVFGSGANRLPYCPEDDINLPPSIDHMSFIQLICAEVLEELKAVDPKKACGPDNIPGRILKEVADVITSSICRIFNLSFSSGVFPDQWKLANVNPVHKKMTLL